MGNTEMPRTLSPCLLYHSTNSHSVPPQFFGAALAKQDGKSGNAPTAFALAPVPVDKFGLRAPAVVFAVRHQPHGIVALFFPAAALLAQFHQRPPRAGINRRAAFGRQR